MGDEITTMHPTPFDRETKVLMTKHIDSRTRKRKLPVQWSEDAGFKLAPAEPQADEPGKGARVKLIMHYHARRAAQRLRLITER